MDIKFFEYRRNIILNEMWYMHSAHRVTFMPRSSLENEMKKRKEKLVFFDHSFMFAPECERRRIKKRLAMRKPRISVNTLYVNIHCVLKRWNCKYPVLVTSRAGRAQTSHR